MQQPAIVPLASISTQSDNSSSVYSTTDTDEAADFASLGDGIACLPSAAASDAGNPRPSLPALGELPKLVPGLDAEYQRWWQQKVNMLCWYFTIGMAVALLVIAHAMSALPQVRMASCVSATFGGLLLVIHRWIAHTQGMACSSDTGMVFIIIHAAVILSAELQPAIEILDALNFFAQWRLTGSLYWSSVGLLFGLLHRRLHPWQVPAYHCLTFFAHARTYARVPLDAKPEVQQELQQAVLLVYVATVAPVTVGYLLVRTLESHMIRPVWMRGRRDAQHLAELEASRRTALAAQRLLAAANARGISQGIDAALQMHEASRRQAGLGAARPAAVPLLSETEPLEAPASLSSTPRRRSLRSPSRRRQ